MYFCLKLLKNLLWFENFGKLQIGNNWISNQKYNSNRKISSYVDTGQFHATKLIFKILKYNIASCLASFIASSLLVGKDI